MSSPYPPKLLEIVEFFETLPEPEKRANLIAYAEHLAQHAPPVGETMDLTDIRKDEECADTVGIFLKANRQEETIRFYVTVGEKAQTLTKALASILCEGLKDASTRQIMDLPPDFVPRIVGQQLFRQRSQTVYYVLTRMKTATKVWLQRRARAEAGLDPLPTH